MRTTAELREGFLAFFEEKGHLRSPSASLIPRVDDHSTLFTSAGMQPQMPFFLGLEPPPAPLTTTAQKVFRTPDIDEVGLDTYHLTFFEMLGNFSFGQYFKEGAIAFATEFIQERLRLDWDRIWVSVHAGDPELGLGPDQVAIDLWRAIGMPAERIVPLPSSENFWSVGGPGPCGPDSEIYFDWGAEVGCGTADCLPGCSRCERFLEFWNLVFMEYELAADRTLTPLPNQNIDTGMGLERAARIVQQVPSVYDTDGYQLIMQWITAESGVAYGDSPEATKAHRILADHGRGMTFLVADGVQPSNEGRGYVLRRVIRRAVHQAHRIGLGDVYRLPAVVVEQMEAAYPELREHAGEIERIVRAEEERFIETLERGTRLFDELAGQEAISGEDAFTLAATYGFPVELTVELAGERGQVVDVDGYKLAMEGHREISRAGGESALQRAAEFARVADFKTEFVGYRKTDVLTQIGALEAVGDGTFLAKLRESPFYPAGGGQVTDAGWIELDDDPAAGGGTRAELVEAFRFGDDQALLFRGSGFAAGDRVKAGVVWAARFPTMANHTATHLLHEALREVLGEHVKQAGSAVRPDKLRFDFTLRSRAVRGRARARRADRERADLREPSGDHVRDADRRGAQARRDDALRREVRRHRARRRGAGRLARALRRHARALDRRDRAVRDPLRGLRRLRRASHRGRYVRRGVGSPPRVGPRARRATRRGRPAAQGAQEACRGEVRGRRCRGEGARREWRKRDRPGDRGARRGRAARSLRPVQAASTHRPRSCSALGRTVR